ncbi:MAG: putative hydroxymethylpyrimidine transporter CytX [Candidatus Atribacteria bacterium]|nr:putative hydroxymethylpyrimidine transporter CytX [Candidatus Atribacteria bacterium]
MSIEVISPERRHLGGWDFFLLWMGAAIAISEIWAGGILSPLGFVRGLWVILLGHLIGNIPFALGGVLGSDWGIPSMVSTRIAFGIRGSYLASILNIIQLLGWTAVMVIICARSSDLIVQSLFHYSNPRLWILLAGLVSTFWALIETEWWKWMQRIAVGALAILSGLMTYVALRNVSWSTLVGLQGENHLPFGMGLDLVIAMPISWLPLVADYARFARNTKGAFWGTFLGYFIASSWMYGVGLISALATRSPDPLPGMLAMGLGVAALLVVLFSTFTTTFLDIYSAGVSFLNLFPSLRGRWVTVLFGLGGTILALIFPMEEYEKFLLFIGAIFVPLFGVVLFDYFLLRRQKIDLSEVLEGGKPLDFGAIISWITGVAIYLFFSFFLSDFGASLPSFFMAGIFYLALKGGKRWKQG